MSLPRNWAVTALGEIRIDRGSSIDPRDYPADRFVLYSVPQFEARTPEIVPGIDIGSSKQTVAPRTVLLCKINPRINRVWVVQPSTEGQIIASTEWIPFFEAPGINPKYLAYFLQQKDVRDFLAQNVSGVGGSLMRVRPAVVDRLEFRLAPEPEQARIVAEIDKQFTRLDDAVAALKRVQANLNRYRASVLQAACEGRLVPTEVELARKEGRDYEPAPELLKRILAERRAKWEADQLQKMTAAGKPPKDDEWKNKYKPPESPETSGLSQLPEGWTWVSLGQLAWSVKDGPHYSPKYSQEGIPFITGGQVRPEGIDFDSAKHISAELHAELTQRCKPVKGDILYTKGGTTGIARVNTYDTDFSVWVHVAVLKLADSVDPFYLQHALNSPFCYVQSQKYTHGVGNQDLGLTRLVRIVLALPPLAEQRRISEEIARRVSHLDELDSSGASHFRHAEALRKVLLRHAFSGKLIPQDPNDEPASLLLERIRIDHIRADRTRAQEQKPKTPKATNCVSPNDGQRRRRVKELAQGASPGKR